MKRLHLNQVKSTFNKRIIYTHVVITAGVTLDVSLRLPYLAPESDVKGILGDPNEVFGPGKEVKGRKKTLLKVTFNLKTVKVGR